MNEILKVFTLSVITIASFNIFNQNASAGNLTVGTVATADMIKVYYPEFRSGSKWIYTSKTNMGAMQVANFDLTTDVTKVTSDTVTVKSTGAGINISQIVKRKDFSPLSSNDPSLKNIKYKYVGKENVTVPEGSYSGADKFSFSNGGKTSATVWFVKGKGVVKSESRSSANGMNIISTVSLKKFVY